MKKYILIVAVCLIACVVCLSFSLVKVSNRGAEYPLSMELKEKIRNETKGFDDDEMIGYSLRLTGRLLSFAEKNDIANGNANCVGYAQLCSSICNYGLEVNGLEGRCRPVVGYVTFAGQNVCHLLQWMAPKKYKGFVKDHDFVEYRQRGETTLFDPSLYDCFGNPIITTIKQ